MSLFPKAQLLGLLLQVEDELDMCVFELAWCCCRVPFINIVGSENPISIGSRNTRNILVSVEPITCFLSSLVYPRAWHFSEALGRKMTRPAGQLGLGHMTSLNVTSRDHGLHFGVFSFAKWG